MTILDFITILYNKNLLLLKKQKIKIFYYFWLQKLPNYYLLDNYNSIFIKNNSILYYNIKSKTKKLIYFSILNNKIFYYSLGLLFKSDVLLKKNIRRSINSLRLLVSYVLKINSNFLQKSDNIFLFNSFVNRKLLNNIIGLGLTSKTNITGLILFKHNSFYFKIKRSIKRRITKRLISYS